MVLLASAFWWDQVAAVPPSRRLFLLPHCLKHTRKPARRNYNEFGLDCTSCGACHIAISAPSQQLGYRVLVAEVRPSS